MERIVKPYAELTKDELYDILRIRAEVFVVEQHCHCLDPDGVDRESIHVFLREEGRILAYLRVFRKDETTARIGRVLSAERGKGWGKTVMLEGIRAAGEMLGAEQIYIEAQCHAIGFYEKLGFRVTSEPFDEEGILHVQMLLCL